MAVDHDRRRTELKGKKEGGRSERWKLWTKIHLGNEITNFRGAVFLLSLSSLFVSIFFHEALVNPVPIPSGESRTATRRAPVGRRRRRGRALEDDVDAHPGPNGGDEGLWETISDGDGFGGGKGPRWKKGARDRKNGTCTSTSSKMARRSTEKHLEHRFAL